MFWLSRRGQRVVSPICKHLPDQLSSLLFASHGTRTLPTRHESRESTAVHGTPARETSICEGREGERDRSYLICRRKAGYLRSLEMPPTKHQVVSPSAGISCHAWNADKSSEFVVKSRWKYLLFLSLLCTNRAV